MTMTTRPRAFCACAVALVGIAHCTPSLSQREPEPTPAVVVEPTLVGEAEAPNAVMQEAPAPDDPPPMKEGDVEDGRPMRDAREEFQLGFEAFQKGDYALARQHFEKSYRLSGKAALLFNLVRAAEKGGDRVGACSYYRRLELRVAKDASLAKLLNNITDPC